MLLQFVSFIFLLTSSCHCFITGNGLPHPRLDSRALIGKLHAVTNKNGSVCMFLFFHCFKCQYNILKYQHFSCSWRRRSQLTPRRWWSLPTTTWLWVLRLPLPLSPSERATSLWEFLLDWSPCCSSCRREGSGSLSTTKPWRCSSQRRWCELGCLYVCMYVCM